MSPQRQQQGKWRQRWIRVADAVGDALAEEFFAVVIGIIALAGTGVLAYLLFVRQ